MSDPWTYAYAGSNNENDVAVYNGNASATAVVKSKTGGSYTGANSAGLYDMSGNVWEWCWDSYYPSANRVLRGGGWINGAVGCAVSVRYDNNPDGRDGGFGFRVVCP